MRLNQNRAIKSWRCHHSIILYLCPRPQQQTPELQGSESVHSFPLPPFAAPRHLPASRTWILQPWEPCLFPRSYLSSLRRHLARSLLASRSFGNISHLRKSVLRLRWWRVLRILWAHSYSLYLVDTQASDIFPVFPLKIISSSKSGHRRAPSRSRWLLEPCLKRSHFIQTSSMHRRSEEGLTPAVAWPVGRPGGCWGPAVWGPNAAHWKAHVVMDWSHLWITILPLPELSGKGRFSRKALLGTPQSEAVLGLRASNRWETT